MKESKIKVSLGVYRMAQLDDEDFEIVDARCWHSNRNGSIQGTIKLNGKYKEISLASFIMRNCGALYDHKDLNSFNNQKSNLRLATQSQNMMNRVKQSGTSSKYKGVCWHKARHNWVVGIKLNQKLIYIGSFASELQAALAYDKKAVEFFGEFAVTNFKIT